MQTRSIAGAVLVLALGAAWTGCQGEKGPTPSDKRAKAASEAAPQGEGASAANPGDAAQAGEVQLAGTLGCGHCNFHVTPDCAAAVKTASGEIYVLDGVQEGSDLWEKRIEPAHQITVTGAILGSDKVKHVAMTSFDLK